MPKRTNAQFAASEHLEGFFDPADTRHNTEQPANESHDGEQIWTEVSNTSKPWMRSKTMWFNLAVTSVGFVTTVLPFAQPFIKPKHFGLITTGIGIVNMALRCATSDKIDAND